MGEKVLVLKLGAIGDVIQTAAAVRFYRQRGEVGRVDWVCGKQVADLVRGLSVADAVFEVDENRLLEKSKKQFPYFLWLVFKLAALGRFGYDRIIIPQHDGRYKLLVSLVRARIKKTFMYDARDLVVMSQRNRIYECYRLLADTNKEIMDLPEILSGMGRNLLSLDEQFPFNLPDSFVAICPGGAKNILRSDSLRRWPIENYVELVERLISIGKNVVVLGGGGDVWTLPFFHSIGVTSLVGKTNLLQMIKILSLADVVVTHDSGPLHMTTLTDAGLVALFGPTPANVFVPFGRKRTLVLREENRVSCSPCYDGRDYADCDDPVCMHQISVEAVLQACIDCSSMHI